MEPVGLTVSFLGPAGLFSNTMDCFEYIQLDRNFGTNFQTSLLKLNNARLQLSRRGQSVGIGGVLKDAQSLNRSFRSSQDTERAESILGQILELFADANG